MEEKREAGRAAVNVWDCGSPLYDSYEIASLGHVIDRHSLALTSPCGSRKEGRHVTQYSSVPRDQEKGLEVKQEGDLFKIIKIFFWKRTAIKKRSDKGIYKPGDGFYCSCTPVGSSYTKRAVNVKKIMSGFTI